MELLYLSQLAHICRCPQKHILMLIDEGVFPPLAGQMQALESKQKRKHYFHRADIETHFGMMLPQPPYTFLTLREVCRWTHMKEESVYHVYGNGTLRGIAIGTHHRFRPIDTFCFITARSPDALEQTDLATLSIADQHTAILQTHGIVSAYDLLKHTQRTLQQVCDMSKREVRSVDKKVYSYYGIGLAPQK